MSSAAAPWREPPDPLAVLREAGVAPPEVIEGARLEDLSRSHSVVFAELPDRSRFVVKRVSSRAHGDGRNLAAELFVYRLASWNPDLARVLPEAVHLDERNQVVALVAGCPEDLFPVQGSRSGFPSLELSAALGRVLAALHGATEGLPLPMAANCGVLLLPDAEPEERGVTGGSEVAAAVAEGVARDPDFATALRRAHEMIRPSCLVHGDVKWDNCILQAGPPARVLLFDWELSGYGDPAWDLGAALAEALRSAVRLDGEGAPTSGSGDRLSRSQSALLGAYGEARWEEGLPARTVGCWIGRVIHLALECASMVDDPDHPIVRELLAVARDLIENEDATVEAVDDALSAAR